MLTEKQKIDAALTEARTELAQARHQREAMAIAERRGELIEKSLVSRQAQLHLHRPPASHLEFSHPLCSPRGGNRRRTPRQGSPHQSGP